VYEANNHAGIVTFVVTESNIDFEAYQFNQTTQATHHFSPLITERVFTLIRNF
jgi:hypothetical protein